MERELIEHHTEWLREFREIRILCDKQQEQMEKFYEAVESVWNNNFVQTLDGIGCAKWEKMLGLKNKDTYSLEERRKKIAGLVAEQRPYTYRRLCCMLDSLCGPGGYTIKLEPEKYMLTVKVKLTSKNMLSDVKELLDRIVPENMIIDADLLYNVYAFLKPYTYAELSYKTCKSLREDVI